MTNEVNVLSLVEDYLAHKDERDAEFQFFETAGELVKNITAIQGLTPAEELRQLEQEINALNNASNSKNWKGKSFEVIMDEVIEKQAEEYLSLNEVIDLLVTVKRNPEEDISENFDVSKEKWVRLVFQDAKVDLLNVEAIAKEINPYPLNVLDKVFTNIESFDEQSVIDYFKALNESPFNYDLKLELLNVLSETHDNFEEGKIPLYFMMTQQLLKTKGFSDDEIAKLFKHFDKLTVNDWTIVDFFNAIDMVLKKCSLGEETAVTKRLESSFEIAADYSMKGASSLEVISGVIAANPSESNFVELESKFHEKALTNFGETHEKTLNELLSEIESSNGWTKRQTAELRAEFREVMIALKSSSHLIGKVIDSCSMEDIKLWVQKLKESSTENHAEKTKPLRPERVAVVMKAFGLFKGYTIRDIQLLSTLLLYKPAAGTLAQINTGEGKTAIIAMLAALFCWEGKKVDVGKILTSNSR